MSGILAKAWVIESQTEDLSGLVLKDANLPQELGRKKVLVEIRAAALNYRDLVVAKGTLGLQAPKNTILGSDGAGIVIKVGSQVEAFKPGDRVVTHLAPREFKDETLETLEDLHLPHWGQVCGGLGQGSDGTLTTCGIFPESTVVKFSDKMSFEEASTLTCSGITAWNGLMGPGGKEVKKGSWVLVQGSGGVSVAALQFAVAIGATVIATTSSAEKGKKLRELGASHVINYRETPDWGVAAKELTPSRLGVDVVLDVAGETTIAQSMKAARNDGVVVLAGLVGKGNIEPVAMSSLIGTNCTVRGILLGSRQMMRDMVAFVEETGVHPALDPEVFSLDQVKEALRKLEEQKHFSKIIIQVPGKYVS